MPRILLLPYIALAAFIGLGYLLSDPQRTSSASFDTARAAAPLQVWGLMFLIGAGVMALAAFTDNREALAIAVFIGGTMYVFWGLQFGVSALTDNRSSVNGPAVYGFIAIMHYIKTWRIWVYYRTCPRHAHRVLVER